MTKLEEMRRTKGWSKAELARRAEIGEADVGKIESGRLRPYDGQLGRLAGALGVPATRMNQLLTAAETPRRGPTRSRTEPKRRSR